MQDLIGFMNTGILFVENGKITTANGENVNIFINGVPVDNLDEATFWAKNALRVEFMESSSNPEFQGKTNILNFVMREYVTGGLTRLNATQYFPNNGNYQASSKLVYGKMTYQALIKGGYSRDHRSGSEQTESYEDVWYEGNHYDMIERYQQENNFIGNNDIFGSFSARYRNHNFLATHVVGLLWNQNPGSGSHGLSEYEPQIINGDMMASHSDRRHLSPRITGGYTFSNVGNWNLQAVWSYNHAHNGGTSVYKDGDASPILTVTSENSNMYFVGGQAIYSPHSNLSLGPTFNQQIDTYKTDYSGSTLSRQTQSLSTTMMEFYFWYKPISKLGIHIAPQYSLYRRNVNHALKTTEHAPGVNGGLYYYIDNKSSMILKAWYAQMVAPVSERNDLILRQTELKWVEGNPGGKISDFYDFSLNYNIRPTQWFNTGLIISFNTHNKESVILYRPGGTEYDGVIGQYADASRRQSFNCYWNVGFSLFSNHLSLHNQLHYSYNSSKVGYKAVNFRVRPNISVHFGNCQVVALYSSPQKYLMDGGMGIMKTYHQYELKFYYGNGNFNLGVSAENIFTRRLTSHSWMVNGPYMSDSRNWTGGRGVRLSLTYTFDYGKKVDPGLNLSVGSEPESSVLGSK